MMRTAFCATRLMGKEIQFEALPQHPVLDLADAALPGGAGIGDDDVDAAEALGHPVEGGPHRCRVGHVAGVTERRASELFRRRRGSVAVDVEQGDLGAGARHRARRRKTDRAGAAGHGRDLPGERLVGDLAELCLFERPVFDVEQIGFADRVEMRRRPRRRSRSRLSISAMSAAI